MHLFIHLIADSKFLLYFLFLRILDIKQEHYGIFHHQKLMGSTGIHIKTFTMSKEVSMQIFMFLED